MKHCFMRFCNGNVPFWEVCPSEAPVEGACNQLSRKPGCREEWEELKLCMDPMHGRMREQPKLAGPTSYERIVLKNPSEHHYMKVQLEFNGEGAQLSATQFKLLVVSALKNLHGEVGSSLPLDLLSFDEKTLCAVLRVCSR
uniref:Uncharacterized protein n=1 Tax=Xenopus tropicalis TaxID=8364 RepID=A0A1B8Y6G8_XENTR